jgi:hypothetical protein
MGTTFITTGDQTTSTFVTSVPTATSTFVFNNPSAQPSFSTSFLNYTGLWNELDTNWQLVVGAWGSL